MQIDRYLKILGKSRRINVRGGKLLKREFDFLEKIVDQNQQFEKLSTEFLAMLRTSEKKGFKQMPKDLYNEFLEVLQIIYQVPDGELIPEEKDRDEIVRYISSLIFLHEVRWDTIVYLKRTERLERFDLIQEEMSFCDNELKKLRTLTSDTNREPTQQEVEVIFALQLKVIENMKKLFDVEEDYVSEMELIYKRKEEIIRYVHYLMEVESESEIASCLNQNLQNE